MKAEYDFSKAKRGAIAPATPGKTRIAIRLIRAQQQRVGDREAEPLRGLGKKGQMSVTVYTGPLCNPMLSVVR